MALRLDTLNRNLLLLNCIRASLRGTLSQDYARKLFDGAVEWDRLLNDARQSNTDPLLYYTLKEANVDGLLPGRVISELKTAYCFAFVHNVFYYRELSDILNSFQSSGIQTIILKGAALAETLYPDISLRPFGDIDLLIRSRDLPEAQDRLQCLGYGENTDREFYQGYRERFEEHFIYRKNAHIPVYVELHTSLPPFVSARGLEVGGFWDRAVVAQIGEVDSLVLSEEDTVLHLCVHIFKHNFSTRLLWLYDLALLILRHGKGINWKLMEKRARKLGIHRVVGLALDQVRRILDVSVPQDATSWLESCRLSPVEKLLLVNGLGLVTWRHTLRLRLVKGVKGKLKLVFGQLFPSRGYIMRRYSLSSPGLMFFGYCYHLCSIFLRVARNVFASTYRKLIKAIWTLDIRY